MCEMNNLPAVTRVFLNNVSACCLWEHKLNKKYNFSSLFTWYDRSDCTSHCNIRSLLTSLFLSSIADAQQWEESTDDELFLLPSVFIATFITKLQLIFNCTEKRLFNEKYLVRGVTIKFNPVRKLQTLKFYLLIRPTNAQYI